MLLLQHVVKNIYEIVSLVFHIKSLKSGVYFSDSQCLSELAFISSAQALTGSWPSHRTAPLRVMERLGDAVLLTLKVTNIGSAQSTCLGASRGLFGSVLPDGLQRRRSPHFAGEQTET